MNDEQGTLKTELWSFAILKLRFPVQYFLFTTDIGLTLWTFFFVMKKIII